MKSIKYNLNKRWLTKENSINIINSDLLSLNDSLKVIIKLNLTERDKSCYNNND